MPAGLALRWGSGAPGRWMKLCSAEGGGAHAAGGCSGALAAGAGGAWEGGAPKTEDGPPLWAGPNGDDAEAEP
ncbi:hypothetical protein [Paractinoplanes brasiliensis]|uniref:hypothetical protein n=1 Tax=Paractinoplanes brasiliensis TaxID=52695 RepID=UPI001061511A|nr:hypothetical protein [Actinoplanes brasiliensis]